MTLLQRREIYWHMYVVSEGLYALGCEIKTQHSEGIWGLCGLCRECGYDYDDVHYNLPELWEHNKYRTGGYWWESGEWKPRAAALLAAYRETFLTTK